MTQATPTLLSEAAHKNDGLYLHKLSGIGKKTCENVVQYLSGKLDSLPETGVTSATIDNLNQTQTDAIDALVSLGYDMNTARRNHQEFPGQGSHGKFVSNPSLEANNLIWVNQINKNVSAQVIVYELLFFNPLTVCEP